MVTDKVETQSISISDLPLYSESLAINWALSSEEIRFILDSVKGDSQILYFSVQLKFLKNSGFFIDLDNKMNQVDEKILLFLSKQIGTDSSCLSPISKNSQTSYRKKIKSFLGYTEFKESHVDLLKEFILHEMQTDLYSKTILQEKAHDFLKLKKIIRPGESVLSRIIASYQKESLTMLYEKISNKMSDIQQEGLLSLLRKQPNLLSSVNYYKKSPPEPSALKINLFISRFNELKKLGVPEIEFSDVTQAIFEKLETLGKTYDSNAISNISEKNKKITLLICTLSSASKNILDHILDMNSKLLSKKERISKNLYENQLKKMQLLAKNGLQFILSTTKRLREHHNPKNTTLFDFIDTVSGKKLDDAVLACEQLSSYQSNGFYHVLESKYHDLRKYMPNLLELDFKGARGTESILQSIEILKQLNMKKSNSLPQNVPTDFIPKTWRKAMCENKNKNPSRRTWEMSLYYSINKAIEKGDMYLSHSKKHRYFWNTVYDEDQWAQEKPIAFKSLGFPEKFDDLLPILKKEYSLGIKCAKVALQEKNFCFIDQNGKLKLKREDALEISQSVKTLKKLIEERMKPVRIETVLKNLDDVYQISQFFLPPEGFDRKFITDRETLFAAITAIGTNLGFDGMAKSNISNISEEKIKHLAQWCIRPDVLTRVNHFLVSKQAEHPLAKLHGDFSRSSSDAERFCIQKSTNLASFYPKAFGYYQKVISIYTHMSDQFSVFNTQVISCGVREASFVLDGLLNNPMISNSHVHCTDTGGFTHQLFALCYLLGFSFQPRLKDLADQTLYKLNKNEHYGEIDSIFSGEIDLHCISEQWEQLIRIILSLKNHVAPAHLVLQKLAARGSSDRVAKAIMELGKLIKTIYILHYLSDEEIRRKVQLQLNRGEMRHYLARHIFFANRGEFKTADYEEMMNIASCLSLLSNATLLWNTPRIYSIVSELRNEGIPVHEDDLRKVSLLLFKHLIVHGTYDFRS